MHDPEFVRDLLASVLANTDKYKTAQRMQGNQRGGFLGFVFGCFNRHVTFSPLHQA
jgi:hypothetical protein